MKFPISISSKKYAFKMDTEKSNEINSLVSAHEVEPLIIKDIVSNQENSLSDPVKLDYSSTEVISGMSLSRRSSQGDIVSLEWFESVDLEGKLLGRFKRVSLDRSASWDDSGFNSCTSDDRDDTSDRLSFDFSSLADDEEEGSNTGRQMPFCLRHRSRSYSLDSESSDYSDSNFQNAKASSCVSYAELDKNFVLRRESNCRLFNEDISRISGAQSLPVRNSVKNSASCAEKNGSIKNVSATQYSLSFPTLKHVVSRRRHPGCKDVNNNSPSSDSILKNLRSSHHSHSSPRPYTVQENGLFTLLTCILYTLVLGFVIGLCGLVFQVIKLFVSKEELQDLRESITKSRQTEKQSSKGKDKTCVPSRRIIKC